MKKIVFSIILILILLVGGSGVSSGQEIVPPTGISSPSPSVVSLDDCIQMAFKEHPQLKSSLALRDGAKAGVRQAEASYYPQISFTSSYSYSHTSVLNMSTDSYSNSLSLSQKILDFGRNAYSVMIARENLNMANYDLLIYSDAIILAIKENYYKVVAAEKTREVNREAVEQSELHLKQARGYYEVGRKAKIEVTKAEVDLANAKLDLIKSENSVKTTRAQLANAIGITGEFDFLLNDTVTFVQLDITLEQALTYARQYRPELMKLKSRENSYIASLNKAQAEYYPMVNGSTGYGFSNQHPNLEKNRWNWGITLDLELFDGGYRKSAVETAQNNLISSRALQERQWQEIYLETQQAYYNLKEAESKVEVLEKALESARENFSLAQGRYEVGVGSNLEFTDARVSLQQAKNNLISAVLDYHIARARLEKSMGLNLMNKDFLSL